MHMCILHSALKIGLIIVVNLLNRANNPLDYINKIHTYPITKYSMVDQSARPWRSSVIWLSSSHGSSHKSRIEHIQPFSCPPRSDGLVHRQEMAWNLIPSIFTSHPHRMRLKASGLAVKFSAYLWIDSFYS